MVLSARQQDIHQSRFSAWLDMCCLQNELTTHALARAYAERIATEETTDGRRRVGHARGPRQYRRDPGSLPKKMIGDYRKSDRTPSADVAFRIGQALRDAGAESGSGPVALYVAGHYDRLVDFFASLATKKSTDRKVGPGSYHVVRLYCTLWASTFDELALARQKISLQWREPLAADAAAAREHLLIRSGYEARLSLYDVSWQSSHEASTLQRARINARAERDSGFPASTWRSLAPWVEPLDARSFSHFREYLGACECINWLSTYPTLPTRFGEGGSFLG